ncbi:MAG: cytochrome b/b6 domain-containing protein [Syntrophorhabdaceae bacterium]
MRKNNIPLHPLPIRIWHWVNALIILALIITGAELRFTGIKIFADYNFVVAVHKYAGYALTISFLVWIAAYQILGGFAGHYLVSVRDLRSLPAQISYYIYGIFRGGPNPFNPAPEMRFNVLQKFTYSFMMFFAMPLIIITGILFGNIMQFYKMLHAIGGLRALDAVHVSVGYLFVIYLMVHLYMSTLGKSIFSHTKSIITGHE